MKIKLILIVVLCIITNGAFAEQVPSGATAVLKVAADIAKSGYREGANNATVFGEWYGMQNQPWCAMYISWCFKEAGLSELVAAQSEKGFASCAIGLRWFTQNKQLVTVIQARPGDIAFYGSSQDGKAHHVGLVVENHLNKNNPEKSYLMCYEGNTSSDSKGSQRDGDGVYLKKRFYDAVVKVARPKY